MSEHSHWAGGHTALYSTAPQCPGTADALRNCYSVQPATITVPNRVTICQQKPSENDCQVSQVSVAACADRGDVRNWEIRVYIVLSTTYAEQSLHGKESTLNSLQ